jgi:hypothetical protein
VIRDFNQRDSTDQLSTCVPSARARELADELDLYYRHQTLYNQIQEKIYRRPLRCIEAEVLLLSAAQRNEPAADGIHYGAFTRVLLDVWNGGLFEGDYLALHAEVYRRLVPGQHSTLLALRPPAFARQRAFSI